MNSRPRPGASAQGRNRDETETQKIGLKIFTFVTYVIVKRAKLADCRQSYSGDSEPSCCRIKSYNCFVFEKKEIQNKKERFNR